LERLEGVSKMGITQQRGLAAETAILNRFIQLNYEVLVPWNRSLGYDLAYVVEKEDHTWEFVRVQCKRAWLRGDGAYLVFKTSGAAEWGRKIHNYYGIAEQFGVYAPDTGKVYMIAVAGAGGSEMHLRLTPPRNNQEKNIKWAKDYEI
jgi:hypothetical protein